MFSSNKEVGWSIAKVIMLTVIIPIVLGLILQNSTTLTWTSVPLHSVLEATGGIIAIVIAMIIYLKFYQELNVNYFNWATIALLTMGIIDIFHASVMPGKLFVWLHSIAVFFGGLFFISVWIQERRVSERVYRAVPLVAVLFALGVSLFSLSVPSVIPEMLDKDGNFTETANWLNLIGGIGFFIASAKFLIRFYVFQSRDDLLLAGHTLLFGVAGILFLSSMIWDMQWWLWHSLRLLAYLIAFYFLYIEFQSDIKKIASTNEMLREKNEKISEYLTVIDENVISSSTDTHGIITDASEAFARISGYRKDELIGKPQNITRHPDMPKELFAELWRTIQSGVSWYGEIKNRKKDGGYYWVDTNITPKRDQHGNITGYTSVRHDITDKKKVELLSITDELTGVYNRRHFNEVFAEEIRRAKRESRMISFMMFDIDFFKAYNDHYGHHKGDEALKAVGTLLRKMLHRAGDYAFRLGGEEFGVLFSGLSPQEAIDYAESIRDQIRALDIEHAYSQADNLLTASIGLVTLSGESLHDETDLYKETDKLLYEAKESGRNKVMHN